MRQAPVRSVSVDLDGDGKPESVAVKPLGTNGERYQLTVGSATLTGKLSKDTPELMGLRVVSIMGDKIKQVVVLGSADSDFHTAQVYRYAQKALRLLGEVPFDPEVPGNGALYGEIWMGFWSKKDKCVLENGRIRLVPQELYAVGKKAKVTQPFVLLSKRGGETLATLGAGSAIELIACALLPGPNVNENHWYLIRSEKGLLGWAQLATFKSKVDGLTWAG
jgi:hypothetical protein